jgi:hypothetical protein
MAGIAGRLRSPEKRLMPANMQSYLSLGGVERVFGRVLARLVWIGLICGHFYVLEMRGRKSGKTFTLLPGLRSRQFQLGAQCPHGW